MKFISKILFPLLIVLSIVSCSKDDDSVIEENDNITFSSKIASGKIDGVDFTFEIGTVYESYFDSTKFSLVMYPTNSGYTSENVCDSYSVSTNYTIKVIGTIRQEVGQYSLSNMENITLVHMKELSNTSNIICTQGAINIKSITETELIGEMNIKSGNDNYIDGQFTLKFCK